MQTPGHSTCILPHHVASLSPPWHLFSSLWKRAHVESTINQFSFAVLHVSGASRNLESQSPSLRIRNWEQLKSTVIFNRFQTGIWKGKVVIELNYNKFRLRSNLLPALLLLLWVNRYFQSHRALRILKQLINRADPHHMQHVGFRQLQNLSFLRLSEWQRSSSNCILTFCSLPVAENNLLNRHFRPG